MTLRVLIVDDEAFARQRLRRLLTEEPDVEVVGEAANGREAIALITTHDPDVVLLDVQMPRVDGFGVLRALDGPAPLVIFVTAFDEHAVAAFNVHAFDYILKPVEPARFTEAIAAGACADRAVDGSRASCEARDVSGCVGRARRLATRPALRQSRCLTSAAVDGRRSTGCS